MATSGAMSTSNQYIKYTITITQNSQNVSGNYSNVTVSVRFYRTNTGYSSYGTGTVYCKINGTTYSASVNPSQEITNSGIILFTKTLNITHGSNGSKTLTCSAWINHDAVTSSEQSYSQALTTIPRATTPSLSDRDIYFGQEVTINLPRASTSFTHTLQHDFYVGSWTTFKTGATTSTTFTPDKSWASRIPNATYGHGRIRCLTYNGSTLIGEKIIDFYAYITTDMIPSVSIAASDPSGYSDTYGGYIQSKSKVEVVLTTAGSYGSTIKSYKVTVDGKTYTSSSFTTGVISNSGTLTISATVTDSRGKSKTATSTITVLSYSSPKISNVIATRCNSDGTSLSSGAYLAIKFNSSISSINSKNTAAYKVRYKKTSETSYTDVTLTDYAGDYSVTNGVYILPADTSSSYNIIVVATDAFSSSNISVTGSSVSKVFSIKTNGTGMAFGKVAETENELDVAWDLHTDKSLSVDRNTFLNGEIVVQKGNRYCVYSYGTTGTNGYIRMARISIKAAEADSPITFVFSRRLLREPMILHARFSSTADTSTLTSLVYDGDPINTTLIKVDDFTWDLYLYKGTAYGCIVLQEWYCSPMTAFKITVTYPLNQVNSKPSGGTTPTLNPKTVGNLNVNGTMNVSSYTVMSNSVNTVGCFRFHNDYIGFFRSNSDAHNNTNRLGWIGYDGGNNLRFTNTSNHIQFYVKRATSGVEMTMFIEEGYFRCKEHGKCHLGAGSTRFRQLLATEACNISSDRKDKTDFASITKAKEFILGLEPLSFRKIDGDSGRLHFGFIAQDVASLSKDIGMGDLSLYQAAAVEKVIDENGEEQVIEHYYSEDYDDKDLMWGLSYEEFIAPIVATVQEQQKQIDEQQAKIDDLQAQINELKELINSK